MNRYEAIAKKFRPQKFSEMYEQDAIVKTLKNAIHFQRIGHAYLFSGTRGTGKTTLARLFAKAINCENLTSEKEPCNTCPSCEETTLGSCLDVIEIDGASNRGIDDIRTLNETVAYAPSNRKYKIYIIDEVHMLTKEAFNALLKTLEEPPKHVLFFFATTELHKVLPTILSRCQIFHLKRISQKKIEAKLLSIAQSLHISVEKEALTLLAKHAQGSLRDAESLFDQLICFENPPITKAHAIETLGLIQTDLFFQLDQAASQYDLSAAFTLSESFFKGGAHLPALIESLAEHYRTILHIQMGGSSPCPEYEASAKIYLKHQILDILDYLIESLDREPRTSFKQLYLEVIFLHIIGSMKKISLPSLVERLETLKKDVVFQASHPSPPKQEEVPKKKDFPSRKTAPHKSLSHIQTSHIVQEKIKQEQILRFASVELNGNLKK